jgi:hypothetical protein
MKSYNILCLTEMFQQLRFLGIVVFQTGLDWGWTDFLSLHDGNNNVHCTDVIIRLLSKKCVLTECQKYAQIKKNQH